MILEPGKLTFVRARFSIAIVILLAAFACTGGPTGDYPSAIDPPRFADAGASQQPGDEEDAALPGGGAFRDSGSAAGSLDAAAPSDAASDAAAPSTGACDPLLGDAGDAGQADGVVAEASVDAQADGGDAAADGGADPVSDGQVDTGANFPDAAGDAQAALSDASSDAPHMPFTDATCVP